MRPGVERGQEGAALRPLCFAGLAERGVSAGETRLTTAWNHCFCRHRRPTDVALGVEGLPEPLEHIIAQVFSVYQARTSDELVTLLRQRYRCL